MENTEWLDPLLILAIVIVSITTVNAACATTVMNRDTWPAIVAKNAAIETERNGREIAGVRVGAGVGAAASEVEAVVAEVGDEVAAGEIETDDELGV